MNTPAELPTFAEYTIPSHMTTRVHVVPPSTMSHRVLVGSRCLTSRYPDDIRVGREPQSSRSAAMIDKWATSNMAAATLSQLSLRLRRRVLSETMVPILASIDRKATVDAISPRRVPRVVSEWPSHSMSARMSSLEQAMVRSLDKRRGKRFPSVNARTSLHFLPSISGHAYTIVLM